MKRLVFSIAVLSVMAGWSAAAQLYVSAAFCLLLCATLFTLLLEQ